MEINLESTIEQDRMMIEKMGAEAFATHLLIEESPTHWVCQRSDGRLKYRFRVIFAPNCVVLTGDISPQLILPGSTDPLSWLLGAVASEDELFAQAKIKGPTFYVKNAFSYIDITEQIALNEGTEDYPLWGKLREEFQRNMFVGHDAYEAWTCAAQKVIQSPLDKVGVGISSDMIWQQQALRTFVRLYRNIKKEVAVSRL